MEDLYKIYGIEDGNRLSSRKLEEKIQTAVENGYYNLHVHAYGQHGIGGRLWKAGDNKIYLKVTGSPGQRLGAMGFANTTIEVFGPASDDVGWLNIGAEIIVHGNATNGVANAMAQGKIYIAGSVGSRSMTMTKENPKYQKPELWILGSAGDFFAEFMAGGIAVICGYEPQNKNNVLGYRPCVGMVGGKIFFRGKYDDYGKDYVKLDSITDKEWDWLLKNLKAFLKKINKSQIYNKLTIREEWHILRPLSHKEKIHSERKTISEFAKKNWEAELGKGGLVGDLTYIDKTQIPIITTGILRRKKPIWNNETFLPPCQNSCPANIPVRERWQLMKQGKIKEALELSYQYTPFPFTICGNLCPHYCMSGCTRNLEYLTPPDITLINQYKNFVKLPKFPKTNSKKIAIIGGGPAGISAAWQLRLKGYDVTIFDKNEKLGGKITKNIPDERFVKELYNFEVEQVKKIIKFEPTKKEINEEFFNSLYNNYHFIIIAIGANKPKNLPFNRKKGAIFALDFLTKSKTNSIKPGKDVIIIGAGNVGIDVAREAFRLGASNVKLFDIQKPLAFDDEIAHIKELGAEFIWPVNIIEINKNEIILDNGEKYKADTIVISIGDIPDLGFLSKKLKTENNFIIVNQYYQTSDKKIFAIGDVVKQGLLADAIGAGRIVANAIDDISNNKEPKVDSKPMINRNKIKLSYVPPKKTKFNNVVEAGKSCLSCGKCLDCGICISVCPNEAISRIEKENDKFELIVDENKCIACGFCANACPTGVWELVENEPFEKLFELKYK